MTYPNDAGAREGTIATAAALIDSKRIANKLPLMISLTHPTRAIKEFLRNASNQSVFLLLCLAFLSCTQSPVDSSSDLASATVGRVQVQATSSMALGALASFSTNARGTGSVAVYRGPFLEFITPSFPIERDSTVVPILGLHEGGSYAFRAFVTSQSGTVLGGSSSSYDIGSLPAEVPKFVVLTANHPTVRYVLLGITPAKSGKSYAMIVDTSGAPVWIREFKGPVVDFQKQGENRYTAWSTVDGGTSHFYEFDAVGTIHREFSATGGLETDPHELRFRGQDYALFGFLFRTMDMTAFGGSTGAAVQGFVVEYHRSGRPPFLWNTFDHFSVTDAAQDISLKGQNVDPWHGNAIEIDTDGNLLVSFRNSDEITKIDAVSGAIIWRLGGKHNQFVFRNDRFNGFSHQHGIRRLDNGNIILFDDGNLHEPQISRAVEYRLDEKTKTADLVWEYLPDPPLFGSALGFAQRLQNGNTLICFGIAQHIIEVDHNSRKLWEIATNEPQRYAYRALAVESLY